MALKRFSGSRSMTRLRQILAFAVIVMVIILVLAFVRLRTQNGSEEKPERPQDPEAALSIRGFRHTATSEGRISWILNAESAKLFSDQNRAELSDVDVLFFTEDRSSARLTSRKGELDTETQNVSVSGSVLGQYEEYILTTESLHYIEDSNIIYADTHIAVAGDNSRFTADSGKFEIDTGTLTLEGRVQVRMNESN